MSATQRVLVAGCGAVGSVFACFLAEAGHEVHVLARGAQLEGIRREGLRVSGIWGDHEAKPALASEDPSAFEGAYDALLLTTKTYASDALLGALRPQIEKCGVAIALQNGLGNAERLQSLFAAETTLAGRVIFGARVQAGGRAEVTVEAEPVLLGATPETGPGASKAAEEWAATFSAAGIDTRPTQDIEAALWAKVFYNAALNPMGALLGLSYGDLAKDPVVAAAMVGVVTEAFYVALAEGVELPWVSPDAYLEHFFARLLPPTARHRSSMLQDLERGRPTEIDAICGEICRRGERRGVSTAANQVLLALLESRAKAPTIESEPTPQEENT